MDLMKIATQLLMSKLSSGGSSSLTEGVVGAALSNLLPTNSGGDLDLGGLLGQMNGGGLASLAASFLGDGANDSMSGNQITDLFGQSKISSFANDLGVDESTASNSLSDIIPNLIDSNSKGGSLLDSVGGGDMLGSLAKGALGSLFK
ncbi:MAG: YidB family protein [Cellvibrionaceae bacterium]